MRGSILASIALAVTLGAVGGCGGTSTGGAVAEGGGKLTLVAYSTPREVLLAISLAALLGIGALRRWATRHDG